MVFMLMVKRSNKVIGINYNLRFRFRFATRGSTDQREVCLHRLEVLMVTQLLVPRA